MAAFIVTAALLTTWLAGREGEPPADPALSGGTRATVFDATADAFARSVPGLSRSERRAFAVGNSFFNRNWVTAPASADGRDGLGPTFNAQSCSSCHFKDGRAQPPTRAGVPELGLLLRLSVPGPDGEPRPVRLYGGQLQDRAIIGVPAEGRIRITCRAVAGRYADGTPYSCSRRATTVVDPAFGPLPDGLQISPRVAPAVFGVGLLEAVPERTILAHADPERRRSRRDLRAGEPRRRRALARDGARSLRLEGERAERRAAERRRVSGRHRHHEPDLPGRELPARSARVRGARPTAASPEIDERKLERVTSTRARLRCRRAARRRDRGR